MALARTLYNSRSVLVLDDPFSALDQGTEQTILENLRVLAKDKIVILFSHRLYQFPTFDRVLFLYGGRSIFSTHEKLMQKNPDYAKLYLEQINGGGGHET